MPQNGPAADFRAWTVFPCMEDDILRADRNLRYFWLRHVPIVASFGLFTWLPFVRTWTGLVPEWCAPILLVHLLAFGSEVHFRIADRIGATLYTTLVFAVNFLVVTAICATPGRFVALTWPLYFMYLPIPSMAAPRSIYVGAMAMGSPFLAGFVWDRLGTSPFTDSIVLLGIVSGLAGFGYMLLSGYSAQMRRERAAFERDRIAHAREEQKLAIADDLHDTLGIALAEAALWQGIGKNTDGEAGREALERAEERLQGAMRELRAAVATLSDEEVSHEATEALLRSRLESLCEASGVTLSLQCKGAHGALLGTRAHQLVKLTEEAAGNAIRHGKPTRLSLSLSWEGGITLSVEDNGQGFEPSSIREGHGLSSLKRRAALLGGRIDIRSRVGEGTLVEFCAQDPS